MTTPPSKARRRFRSLSRQSDVTPSWRVAPALLLAVSTPAAADERILRFLSDVQIQKDSSLDVTETIDVRAENNRINHGIYRDFPTRYRGRQGSQVRVGFTFENATLDGHPVRFLHRVLLPLQ